MGNQSYASALPTPNRLFDFAGRELAKSRSRKADMLSTNMILFGDTLRNM
jgi:hypothetical protein